VSFRLASLRSILEPSHWKVEDFGYTEDRIEIYSFSINFRATEIKIETKKFSISENNSKTTHLSIVFSHTETQSENLYFVVLKLKKTLLG